MKIFYKAFLCTVAATLAIYISDAGLASQSRLMPLQPTDFSQCLFSDNSIPVDNTQVLTWEDTTPNYFRARAHIEGKIHAVYWDRIGYKHFGVQIGPAAQDGIEVIYNVSFGALPELNIGDNIEACGDYITFIAPAEPTRAPRNRAILHWVHKSKSRSHDSGFVKVNGVLFGGGNGLGN